MALSLLSLAIGAHGSLHFWLRWPPLLLTACIVVSSCILIAKKPNLKHLLDAWKTRKSGTKPIPNVDTGIMAKMGKVMVLALVFLAGIILGEFDSSHRIHGAYRKENAAWLVQITEYQQHLAAWKARQPKTNPGD